MMRRWYSRLMFLTLLVLSISVSNAVDMKAQDGEATEVVSPPADSIETPPEPPPETTAPTEVLLPTELPPPTETAPPEETVTLTAPPVQTELPSEATESSIPTEADLTPTETPVSTEEFPQIDLPAEPSFDLLLTESFDSGDLSAWRLGEGWTLVTHDDGLALGLVGTTAGFQLAQSIPEDSTLEVAFVGSGAAIQLLVRQSDVGAYGVTLNPDDTIWLERSGTILQATQIDFAGDTTTWHRLRLSVFGAVLRVLVDDREVIALIDDEPLPSGTVTIVGLISDPSAWLQVDDVNIGGEAGEFTPPQVETAEVIPTSDAVEATPETTSLADDGRVIINPIVVTPTPTPEDTATPETTPAAAELTETAEATIEATPEITAEALPKPLPAPKTLEVGAQVASNDSFASARTFSTVPYVNHDSTTGATTEIDEPPLSCTTSGASVWYKFTAPYSGVFAFTTDGSDYDTTLAAYSGTALNNLVELACDDDSGPELTSYIQVGIERGETIYVQAGGYGGDSGNLAFSAHFQSCNYNVPDGDVASLLDVINDANTNGYSNTICLAYDSTYTLTAIDNTTNGPNGLPVITSDLFIFGNQSTLIRDESAPEFRIFNVGASGSLVIDNLIVRNGRVSGSDKGGGLYTEGVLNIHDSCIVGNLAPQGGGIYNNGGIVSADRNWWGHSTGPSGTWYGAGDAINSGIYLSGGINTLRPGCPTLAAPANDLLSAPVIVSGLPYSYTQDARYATTNSNEPNTSCAPDRANTLWFRVQPIDNQSLTVNTQSSSYDTVLAVYKGVYTASFANLQEVTCNDDSGGTTSALQFDAQAGQTYFIMVAKKGAMPLTSPASLNLYVTSPNLSTIAAPVLSAPVDNAVLTSGRPKMSWKSVTGATGYRLQISDDANFVSLLVNTEIPGTTYSYTMPFSLAQKLYYWRVSARDAGGKWGSYSALRRFTVSIPRAPLNTSYTTSLRPTFSWYSMTGALGYQLQIASSLDFTTIVRTFETTSSTSYTPPITAPMTYGIYYWRVNVNLGSGYASSPIVWRLTISPKPPNIPTLLTPGNSTSTNNHQPTFTWGAVTGAFRYQIQIDNNSTFASPEVDYTDTLTNYTSQVYFADGTYYWRVRSLNDLGVSSSWSRSWRFTIDSVAPLTPILKTPLWGATVTTNRPTFSWASVSGASHYEVQIGTTNPPTLTSALVSTTSYTPPSALLVATHYWRVRALDAAGNPSPWSETRSLIVQSSSSAAPLLNRSTTTEVVLSWTPLDWATMYEIQVDNDPKFGSPEFQNSAILPSVLSIVTNPLPNGTYYWRVRARLPNGTTWGKWSTSGIFTVES